LNASTKLVRLPLWFFVDVGEDLVMADDVVTPLNLLIVPVEKKKLEKTLLM
jgi:hypothetical protein